MSDATGYGGSLFAQHAQLLAASAIAPEVAAERGYVSVDTAVRLKQAGFAPSQCNPPGLLIPVHGVDGAVVIHEYRPDNPRTDKEGRERKYEKPYRSTNRLDVPARVLPVLRDPAVPLWITEGARKVDAAVSVGLACIGLAGVDCWRGTDPHTKAKNVALADWHDVALRDRDVVIAFDSDVMTKTSVRSALAALGGFLHNKGARVRFCVPATDEPEKCGLDDYLAGHTRDELEALVVDTLPAPADLATVRPRTVPEQAPPAEPRSLEQVVAVYRKWLYLPDLMPLFATLGTHAANRLDGDPVWLMVVGGSGATKTETIAPLAALDNVRLAATLTEAGLLSGTSRKERVQHAHGGLLKEIGATGTLILKDFTSILSMNRDTRAALLAALREIYDGAWSRHVGTDGGQTLEWAGKLGVIGACTTAWDGAHAVQATMGERFLLVRGAADIDKNILAGHALDGAGNEPRMRAELGDAVRGLYANNAHPATARTPAERETLITLAALVATARSPIDRDYQGDIELVLDQEAPTRLIKQLATLWKGLDTIGCTVARDVVVRVGLDSMPKLRRQLLDVLADGARRSTSEIAAAVQHPTKTVQRRLEDLAAHKVVIRRLRGDAEAGDRQADKWQIAEWAATALRELTEPGMSVSVGTGFEEPSGTDIENDERRDSTPVRSLLPDIPGSVGDGAAAADMFRCAKCGAADRIRVGDFDKGICPECFERGEVS